MQEIPCSEKEERETFKWNARFGSESSPRILTAFRPSEFFSNIERDRQLRIDGDAQPAGETQAESFGEAIAQGPHKRLVDPATQLERTARRLSRKYILGMTPSSTQS